MAKKRWIKVYFDMLSWEWYNTPGMLDLWVRLLLNADEDGVVLLSVNRFAQECGVSRQRLRTMLDNLVLTKQITKSATKSPTKFATKLTICNYESYQGSASSKQPSSQPSLQPSSQPSFNQVDGTIPFSSSLRKSEHSREEEREKKEISPKGDTKKENESDPDFDKFMTWLREKAPAVARLDAQAERQYRLTAERFRALREKYGSKTVARTILEMENWAGLRSKRTAYLTLEKWLEKAKGEPASAGTKQKTTQIAESVNSLWRKS